MNHGYGSAVSEEEEADEGSPLPCDGSWAMEREATSAVKSPLKRQGPFERLGLEQFVASAIRKLGYNLPTPIQRRGIPVILAGHDVVAMARTGSGKTVAFAAPAVQRLREHATVVGVRCVVLEPTRELAFQVAKVLKQLSRLTDLRVCVLVGGAALEKQFHQLASNPDIIVAAPGRLVHHMVESELSLSSVQYLVVDEADQLFEMGMVEQTSAILKDVSRARQCIITSATLPAQLVDFSRAGLRSPEFIRLDADNMLSETLDLWFVHTRSEDKTPCLLFLLREVLAGSSVVRTSTGAMIPQGSLVFVASRHHVDFLAALLERAAIKTSVAYGSMDQQARMESLAKFRNGLTKVLIVTDVAARGLDIPVVGAVVNFDFPTSPKHFVHRAGRTARAGRSGIAISLVAPNDVPYAMEVSLYAGIKLDAPAESQPRRNQDSDSLNSSAQDERSAFRAAGRPQLSVGSAPDLSIDVEFVRRELELADELRQLHSIMTRAQLQYNKMRRPASRESVRRARELGGTRLFAPVHSGFASAARLTSSLKWPRNHARHNYRQCQAKDDGDEIPRCALLQHLRQVKPSNTGAASKSGGVAVLFPPRSLQRCSAGSGYALHSLDKNRKRQPRTVREVECCGGESAEQLSLSEGQQDEGCIVAATASKPPRLAAAQRRQLKRLRTSPVMTMSSTARRFDPPRGVSHKPANGAERPTAESTDVFDWQTAAAKKSRKLYASTSQSLLNTVSRGVPSPSVDNSNNRQQNGGGLQAISDAQMDLIPDTEESYRKARVVRKWNAIRKRYTLTPVDETGRALGVKQLKKRNEAGVLVRGELRKTGLYKRWSMSTKNRIQRVGEIEDEANRYREVPHHRKTTGLDFDFTTTADCSPPPLASLTKDKGLVEAIEKGERLTHKQKRKLKRLKKMQTGCVTRGRPAPRDGGVRDARQLSKVMKDALKRKAKQNRFIRERLRRESKEAHMNKRDRQARGRAPYRRSFSIPKGGLGRRRMK